MPHAVAPVNAAVPNKGKVSFRIPSVRLRGGDFKRTNNSLFAEDETRTRTPLRGGDFKSPMSTIPSPRRLPREGRFSILTLFSALGNYSAAGLSLTGKFVNRLRVFFVNFAVIADRTKTDCAFCHLADSGGVETCVFEPYRHSY